MLMLWQAGAMYGGIPRRANVIEPEVPVSTITYVVFTVDVLLNLKPLPLY